MELPAAPECEALLVPDLDTVVRGDVLSKQDTSKLAGLLTVAGPVTAPIGPGDVDDPDLKVFVQNARGRYSYYAVRLACSFRPADGEPFTEALVSIDLAGAEAPVAWSIDPVRLDQVGDISSKFTFGAQLKLLTVTFERGVGHQAKEPSVLGYGVLSAEPYWELYRVAGADLRGTQLFKLVVQAAAGAVVDGTASIQAKIQRRRYGLMKYVVEVPGNPPGISFRLKA